MNKNIAILGALFGDEGKGHITHTFSSNYDWVVRFNGGANAGHTIYRNGKKYVHNLLPSVDWRVPHVRAFMSSGMVIDLEQLFNELNAAEKDFPGVSRRIFVDPDVFVVLEKHKEEDKAANGHLGTTNRGIGPAYMDKLSRKGTRVRDLIKDKSLVIGALTDLGVNFKSVLELKEDFSKATILYEGAQGILLDINHGTYPYVSCSDCTTGGILSSGFGFAMPSKVYGVTKAYMTRVGEGPFPTELHGKAADNLREAGKEYGATTGRPRRIGWLDLPALKYAAQKGGLNGLIITKLDILDGFDRIPICFKYTSTPMSGSDFFGADPTLMNSPGWENSKDYQQIKDFLHNVEFFSGVKVEYVSCGTDKLDVLKI